MKKLYAYSILLLSALLSPLMAQAAVSITDQGGWFESAWVKWTKADGLAYNVYVSPAASDSWTKLDGALVREYAGYGRADALGLAAGNYKFKVVPVQDNAEVDADASVSASVGVVSHDRGGFAHFKTASSTFNPANGIGAYKNDGTLKDGAKIIYVTADNAKTISTDVITGKNGKSATITGFQAIIDAYQKGLDKTPIDFRIVGMLTADDLDGMSSSSEGVQIKGKGSYSELNITIEGVGSDATVHGFGFLLRNACSVEIRNLAIMNCLDDAVSMDTDNSNLWIHNLDLFYGQAGGASDQAKGDGTLDIKGDSKYCTMSYNHLWDSGKSSLCGMTGESGPNYITYHHNWFDHSDSRHPRIRTMSVHIYNNYFDGNAKYGVGAAASSDAFVENNYFRNCKYPMLISKQGSDIHNGVGTAAQTKGTFSGEDGGIIKAIGNYMTGQTSFEPWEASGTQNTHFDAYVVSSKSEQVPSTVTALLGGHAYNNFDTDASLMYTGYTCHEASEVPTVVTGDYGAGRVNHGDFSWTFGPNEDTNYGVITALKKAIVNYKSTLVGFFGQAISNGGATDDDHKGSSDDGNSGAGSDDDDDDTDYSFEEESYITGENAGTTSDEYFWFSSDNAAQVNAWIADGTLTLVNGTYTGTETAPKSNTTSFKPEYSNAGDDTKSLPATEQTGSLQIAQAEKSGTGRQDGGAVIFKCPKGVTTFATYAYRTGSFYYDIYTSTDSVNWKKAASVEKGTKGILEKNFSAAVADTTHCVFIKIQNTSNGGLNLQGIRLLNKKGATVKEPSTDQGGDNPGGEDPNPGGGDTPGSEDATIVYFEGGQPSSSSVSVSGNYSTSKGTVSYGGKSYGECVKMESATSIAIVPPFNCTVTLVFDKASKKLKLDGTSYTTDANGQYSFAGVKGTTYTLTKGDAINLFLVIFTPTANGISGVETSEETAAPMYDLLGRRVSSPRKGQVYIQNGLKRIAK